MTVLKCLIVKVSTNRTKIFSTNLGLPGIKEIEINTTQFQREDTDSCGKYVLYFLINRLYNLDHEYKDFLELIFCQSLDENEKKVDKFYQDILNNS